jgi:hypothetical protein
MNSDKSGITRLRDKLRQLVGGDHPTKREKVAGETALLNPETVVIKPTTQPTQEELLRVTIGNLNSGSPVVPEGTRRSYWWKMKPRFGL